MLASGGWFLSSGSAILRDVIPILRMHDESAGVRVVIDHIPSDGDRALARLLLRFELFGGLRRFGFACRCLVFRLRMSNHKRRWHCDRKTHDSTK